MSIQYVTTCPHCKVNNSYFSGENVLDFNRYVTAYLVCENTTCHRAILIEYYNGQGFTFESNRDYFLGEQGLRILNQYPSIEKAIAPEGVPEGIAECYIDGVEILDIGKTGPAVSSFRTTIDMATKDKSPDLSSYDLSPRITKMFKGNIITEAMKDWAHNVRIDGNAGIHDGKKFSMEEATEIKTFTEMLLIYLYTMPTKVASATAARESDKEDS